jgi:hypothetical protein
MYLVIVRIVETAASHVKKLLEYTLSEAIRITGEEARAPMRGVGAAPAPLHVVCDRVTPRRVVCFKS